MPRLLVQPKHMFLKIFHIPAILKFLNFIITFMPQFKFNRDR